MNSLAKSQEQKKAGHEYIRGKWVCLYVSADSAASEPVFIMLCTKSRIQKVVSGLRERNTQIPGQQIPVLSIAVTGNSCMKKHYVSKISHKNCANLYELKLNNKKICCENSGKK
jgi:hypothetical protein